MTLDRVIAAALAVNADNLALGHEVVEVEGGRLVRNTALPDIWDANHVDTITAADPREIDALIERAGTAFRHCRRLRFDVDPRTPPQFEARLVNLGGFTAVEALLMLLEGPPGGAARPLEIRQIVDEAGWGALQALGALDWDESSRRRDGPGSVPEPDVAAGLHSAHRSKSPPVRFWLGCVDGVPRGYLSSWEGNSGVGQVESLFVQPEFRHRGLATALLHHCIADCRAHGAGPVCLVADPSDTPQQMYAAMGFRPVAVIRHYMKLMNRGGAEDGDHPG